MNHSSHIHTTFHSLCGVQLPARACTRNLKTRATSATWTHTIHKKQPRKEHAKIISWKWPVTNSEFTWTEIERHPPACYTFTCIWPRSKFTLLQIWAKVTACQRASTTHMWSTEWLHRKMSSQQWPPFPPSNTQCSPSTQACSCLWCHLEKTLAPISCRIFVTTWWTKPSECAFRNQWHPARHALGTRGTRAAAEHAIRNH